MSEKTKAAIYTREFKSIFCELNAAKWGKFYQALGQMKKDGVEILIVHSPEVLGDTYEELVTNLSAIASHDLKLAVIPPEEAGYKVTKNPSGLA